MTADFTVIIGDSPAGKNEKGFPLVEFLNVFSKKKIVQVLSPKEVDSEPILSTKYLFVFLPTCLTLNQLKRINYKKLFLADYSSL